MEIIDEWDTKMEPWLMRLLLWWVEREQAREDLMRWEACGGR
jgi:hypothetical protein